MGKGVRREEQQYFCSCPFYSWKYVVYITNDISIKSFLSNSEIILADL